MVRDLLKEISGGVSVLYQLNYPPKELQYGTWLSLSIIFHSTPFCHVCRHILMLNNYSFCQFAYYRSQTASPLFSFWSKLAFVKVNISRNCESYH